MKFSKYFVPTMIDEPSKVESVSQKIMVKSGMIKMVSNGFFIYLPNFMKIFDKVVDVVSKEMENADFVSTKFPGLVSKDDLLASGRWNDFDKDMFKLIDRTGKEFAVGSSSEEYACFLANSFVNSYKDLPFLLYQIKQNCCDFARSRGDFLSKKESFACEAFSFHTDMQDLNFWFEKMVDIYEKIFKRLGLKVVKYYADNQNNNSGNVLKFVNLCADGETKIAECECGCLLDLSTLPCERVVVQNDEAKLERELVKTPNKHSIEEVGEFLHKSKKEIVKSLVYNVDGELKMFLVRGDRQINEAKIKKYFGAKSIEMASEMEIVKKLNSVIGFIGPIACKNVKIYADYEIEFMKNFVVGANVNNFHLVNCNLCDFECEFGDFRMASHNCLCPKCAKPLKVLCGNEIGHISKLGIKYTARLNSKYVDSTNQNQLLSMGNYLLELEKIIFGMVETYADEKGIDFPRCFAPFWVDLITINIKDESQKLVSQRIYDTLTDAGLDVLWDDRDNRFGAKLYDSELMGIPFNIIVGKNAVNGQVEYQKRLGEKLIINIEDVLRYVK